MRVELKPHQRKAVEQLANGKILYGGTGVGKGITALAYFYEKVCGGDLSNIPSMKEPRDLYILTTKKKRDELDWEEDALKIGLGTHDDSLDGINVVVDTWNNIKKYAGVKNAFFLFDEQRVVGSGAWSRTFISLAKSNQWIMLSATPGDTWLDYIPVFVANGWYKNRTEFKQRHVVYNTFSKFPKVDRYLETGTLVRHRKNVLVHMPFQSHTRRIQHEIEVSYNKELFDLVKEKRWNPYEERPIRDVAELFSVMRKVVNSDITRLAAVQTLTQVHPKLIVFYNFNYELDALRQLGKTGSHTGKSSGINTRPISASSRSTEGEFGTPSATHKSTKEVQTSGEPSSRPSTTETGSDKCPSSREMLKKKQKVDGTDSWGMPMTSGSSTVEMSSTSPKNRSHPDLSRSGRSSDTDGSTGAPTTDPTSISTETPVEIAEWNGHKHQPIPKSDRWVYLVQYVAGSEGWNCITTNATCHYSMTYSYKHWHQSYGRTDRMNSPFVDHHYYRLMSSSFIDLAVARALDSKKSFNEASQRLWTP